MDKKKLHKSNQVDDLKGFEDFIDSAETGAQVDPNPGKNVGGESYTFLMNDNSRLKKISNLVAGKLPVIQDHEQGEKIIESQRKRNAQLKIELFQMLSEVDSPLEKSMSAIFNPVFKDLKK